MRAAHARRAHRAAGAAAGNAASPPGRGHFWPQVFTISARRRLILRQTDFSSQDCMPYSLGPKIATPAARIGARLTTSLRDQPWKPFEIRPCCLSVHTLKMPLSPEETIRPGSILGG